MMSWHVLEQVLLSLFQRCAPVKLAHLRWQITRVVRMFAALKFNISLTSLNANGSQNTVSAE